MKNTNEFLYLFDLLDFDENGNVCATKAVDLQHAQSNFLYLVAKYNRIILKSQKEDLPSFFIEELADLLIDVEIGEKTFDEAKTLMLKNCTKQVQALAVGSDKNLLTQLCNKVTLETIAHSDKNVEKFLKNFKFVTNTLEKENKLTREHGKRFSNIIMMVANSEKGENLGKTDKKQLYNDIITAICFAKTAEKVSSVQKVDRTIV